MNCPNCGAVHEESCRFCGVCGAALTTEKKGSHRVPIIIMLVLTVIGTCVFFATGGSLAPAPPRLPQFDQPFGVDDGVLMVNYDLLWEETEITVPAAIDGQTVTTIDDAAFSGFDGLTGLYLPDSVTRIGEFAFEYCGLRGMDLPASLTAIGDYAFFNCVSLEAVHIPASVEEMGEEIFYGCDSLTFIFYDGTIDQWEDLYPYELLPQTAVCCTDGTFYQD